MTVECELSQLEKGQKIPNLNGKKVFCKYQEKPSNKVFRWNLLWLLFILLAPYPLWLSFVSCSLSYEITIIVNIVLTVNFIYATVMCWAYMWRMLRIFKTTYQTDDNFPEAEKISHIVVLPTYKEPLELLLETISSIASQTVASSIVLVIGMEEKTPEREMKVRLLKERYQKHFLGLLFSIHPYGVAGEIPGACSNRNYAARTAVQYMIDKRLLEVDLETGKVNLDYTTVTVCDADTTFFYRYFENLTHAFLKEDRGKRYEVCWQSPLFYNISLDKRWFFTRVMGILRSYFMIGFLIGCNINTMSIYSMSLRLLVQSRFFHPGYQMDDIIYTLSAMKATGKRIQVRILDVPTLSGPTSGVNIMEEFREWVTQATRWTIGAAEVFHYFFLKLLRRNYFFSGLKYFWWFVYYYGFVLCVSGLIQISTLVIQLISFGIPSVSVEQCRPFQAWFKLPTDFPYQWILPSQLLFVYVTVFATAFFMDSLIRQVLALEEHVGIIRNSLHFLSCQFVLWMYCFVELKAIITVAIYGKSVCGHKASEKHALVDLASSTSIANLKLEPSAPPSIAESDSLDGMGLVSDDNEG